MLRAQPRPKLRQATPVPDELRESLREALDLIHESFRDPDVRVDYGDAIQSPRLCGGRVGTEKRPYEFTYDCSADRSRWRLAFHPLEIEDIVDGHTTQITLHCCTSAGCGHKSNDPEFLCDCDYVEDPLFNRFEFPAAIEVLHRLGIDGLTAASTREDVIALLGEPTRTGGGQKHTAIGYIHPWIKYQRPDCQLRFEFHKSTGIRLVTVLPPDWEPGK